MKTTPDDRHELLNEKETAAFLGIEPQTLALWRSTRRYDLPFVRVGRCIRYSRADIDRWIDKNRVTDNGKN